MPDVVESLLINQRILTVDMHDLRTKLFDKTQGIDAHANEVRGIVVNSNIRRIHLLQKRTIRLGVAAQRVAAGPPFDR